MKTRTKILLALTGMVVTGLLLGAAFGSEGRNNEYKPQDEFKLDPWLEIKLGPIDMSLNKAVLYLFLASALTIFVMTWIANRMEAKPNRVQAAVEAAYELTHKNIAFGNMEAQIAAKWFPFVAALFFFILASNLIGYIPLPINTHEPVDIFGVEVPSLAIYAATANLSVPLVLTLVVWVTYHVEGIRTKGVRGYFRSWIPAGVEGFAAGPIFVIEVISHFVRLISLSVRLFANLLAGHLLILFMAGGLVVLLGLAAIGIFTLPVAVAFFIFEVGLIATLQAFIFATLTAIYIGTATGEAH